MESISAGNVIIRNNRFVNCGYEPAYISGVIESHTNPGSTSAPAGVYRNIIIGKNIIQGTSGSGIKLGSADEVDITGNIIQNCKDPGILIYNSRNINLSRNLVRDCSAGMKIEGGCDESTITSNDNTGF